MSGNNQRAAFLVVPHEGGTYSVYASLREALLPLGIKLRWVGASVIPEMVRERFAGEMEHGDLVDSRGMTEQQIGAVLLEKLIDGRYGLVFVNVITGHGEMSTVAYLPSEVKRVMIAHNITRGTGNGANMVKPYVNAAVGVCERIRKNMIGLGFEEGASFCVPNTIDIVRYSREARQELEEGERCRVVFLGRISDSDKGVFWLPGIMNRLREMEGCGGIALTVAGDGLDQATLKEKCAGQMGITFLGRVSPTEVPALMARHDVMIMPSRFEGFGYALIEAMAAGCVPVVSRISGVTDYVVKERETGMLFPIGDEAAAAERMAELARDPELRRRLAAAGRADVAERFSFAAMTHAYERVLKYLETAPPARNRFGQPFELLNLHGQWRRFIPASLKNALRKKMYR